MNYQRIYNNIINQAKNRILNKDIYIEKHHIIPKSLGGLNNKENIVSLTLREHFLCHKLLIQIYPDSKELRYALWMMTITTIAAKEGKGKIKGRVLHFLNNNEKHINISMNEYAHFRALYCKSKKYTKLTEKQRQNISNATKNAMKSQHAIECRRSGVTNYKFYYNKDTHKCHKWFEGLPPIDLNIYAWGRGYKQSDNTKNKYKDSLKKYKKVFYYNENLKCSTCFCIDDIKNINILPHWIKGRKYGGYDKMKTFIIPLFRNVHYLLVLNLIFIDKVFYYINKINKSELSLGLLLVNEEILENAINNNISFNDIDLINKVCLNINKYIGDILLLNNKIYN